MRSRISYALICGLLAGVMMLTSCRKASPYPTGTFVSDTVGTIVIDDEKVHFENMDPDFLENYICTCQTALESIRRIHEGQKMTAEEMETYRKEYRNTFDVMDFVNSSWAYECEQESNDLYAFSGGNSEEDIFGFDFIYYVGKGYIDFDGEQFYLAK